MVTDTKLATVQLYHGENMLHCDEMIMMSIFVLDKHTELDF